MFRGSYQRKLLTVLYSGGSNPLEIWDIQVKNGWTRRVKDEEMGSIVFEICGTNVATAYIISPPDPRSALGISLPFITMFIKNLKRYFTFEIQIMDDKHMRRRFRFSNYQSSTKVRPFTCSVPLALKPGWNQMQLNLANFTMRAYGTNYIETQRVQIHANCRIRRIYFSDRLYTDEELPKDYRICLNLREAAQRIPSQEQPEEFRVSLDKFKTPTSSSILKQPSILKTVEPVAPTVSEVELRKTLSKRTASETERSSLKEIVENISQFKSVQSVTFLTESLDGSAKFQPEETTSKLDNSSESLLLENRQSLVEEIPESVEVVVPQDKASVEINVDQVTEDEEETKQQSDQNLTEEVSAVLEESTELESPRTEPLVTESEFSEPEPIPESDSEEPPSSPDP